MLRNKTDEVAVRLGFCELVLPMQEATHAVSAQVLLLSSLAFRLHQRRGLAPNTDVYQEVVFL